MSAAMTPTAPYVAPKQVETDTRQLQTWPNEQRKLDSLLSAGRFVLTLTYPVYCLSTNVRLGNALLVISDHATFQEAYSALYKRTGDDVETEFMYGIEFPDDGSVQP